MDLQYFKAIQGYIGTECKNDVIKRQAKENLKDQLVNSINKIEGKRNGVKQTFVVTPSQVTYKYNIEALPDEEIFIGDEIECFGHHWIVTEVTQCNPIQKIGLMWLCNFELKFQNFNSDILSQWVVLDSGVYSTTLTHDTEVQQLNKQFKLYAPYNQKTQKFFIDKRIAIDTRCDSHGNDVLEVFKITGMNKIGRSYGIGGHLLICELRSDEYNKEVDNIDLLICNYIQSQDIDAEKLKSKIIGRTEILLGTTRKYVASFLNQNNEEYTTNAIWEVDSDIDDLQILQYDNCIEITVPDEERYIGNIITLSMVDTNSIYDKCNFEIEVVAL